MAFCIEEALGVTRGDPPGFLFSKGLLVTLIARGNRLIPPWGSTVLQAGNHVYALAQREARG